MKNKKVICYFATFFLFLVICLSFSVFKSLSTNNILIINNKIKTDQGKDENYVDVLDDIAFDDVDKIILNYEILNGDFIETISVDVPSEFSNEDVDIGIDYYISNKENKTIKLKENNDIRVLSIEDIKKDFDLFKDDDVYINRCFDLVYTEFNKKEKKFYFNTSSYFKCMSFEYIRFKNFDISIKSFNKVYENNADEVDNNVYIWHFDRNNYKNKNITIVLGNGKYVWYYKFRFLFASLIVVCAIMLVVLFVIKIFKKSSNRANKI